MGQMGRIWVGIGALDALVAVALAAAGAHALAARLEGHSGELFRTALQIQGWHALALIFCGLWLERAGLIGQLAPIAFLLGSILFCGAVYALAIGGIRLPSVAPIGGVTLMIGWLLLAISAFLRA